MRRLRLCCLCFPLFPEEPMWTRGRFICCCHLRSYVLSLLAALACFLGSLATSCHASTTNRFHINFFPHCIPPRLVSSVVSCWSSFRCKACWESTGCCSLLLGTCLINFLSYSILCVLMLSYSISHFIIVKRACLWGRLFYLCFDLRILCIFVSITFVIFSWISFILFYCLLWCIVDFKLFVFIFKKTCLVMHWVSNKRSK